MPFPLLLIPLAAKAIALAKAGALAAKGGAVIGKTIAVTKSHALVAHAATNVIHTAGVAKATGLAVGAAITVGSAVVLYDLSKGLIAALEEDDLPGALRKAGSLVMELKSAGGFTPATDALDQFIAEHGTSRSTAMEVVRQVSAVLHAIRNKLPAGAALPPAS